MKTTTRNSIILFSLLFLACVIAANAQRKGQKTQDVPISVTAIKADDLENSFYAGLSLGVASGSIGDASSFTYGVVTGYSFKVSKSIGIGPEVDYTHFVGKDWDVGGVTIEGDGFDFASISAAFTYNVNDYLGASANVGYGTYLEENSDFEGYFAVGLRWDPIPGLTIRPEVSFGDENEQYRVRVYRTF